MILARSQFIVQFSAPMGPNITELQYEVYIGASLLYGGSKKNYDLTKNTIEFDFSTFARDFINPKIPIEATTTSVFDSTIYAQIRYAFEFTNGTNTFGGLGYENSQPFTFVNGYVQYKEMLAPGTTDVYTDMLTKGQKKVLMNEGTYEYLNPQAGGSLWLDVEFEGLRARYTSFNGLSTVNNIVVGADAIDPARGVPTVYDSNIPYGNKLEILNGSDEVIWTGNFYPISECKYTPLRVDFVNNLGGWQRMWLFKANYESMNLKKEQYSRGFNTLQYLSGDSPMKVINNETMKTLKGNTGWVKNDFNTNVLEPLMNSENIFVDGYPCILKTNNVDLVKHINENMINYTLEFEQSFNTIFR